MSHTKEPWRIAEGYETIIVVHDSDGNSVMQIEASDEDARRVVACVNACAGFEDPEAAIASLQADYAIATLERDELAEINKELLEALETLFDLANHFHVGEALFSGDDYNRKALEAAEAAIRKAEQQ